MMGRRLWEVGCRKSLYHCLPPTAYCLLFLAACTFAQPLQTQPASNVYPVETAREDGDWTLLYRDVPLEISKDGFVIFLIPSEWTPKGLSDHDHIRVSSVIGEDRAVLTLERIQVGMRNEE